MNVKPVCACVAAMLQMKQKLKNGQKLTNVCIITSP